MKGQRSKCHSGMKILTEMISSLVSFFVILQIEMQKDKFFKLTMLKSFLKKIYC